MKKTTTTTTTSKTSIQSVHPRSTISSLNISTLSKISKLSLDTIRRNYNSSISQSSLHSLYTLTYSAIAYAAKWRIGKGGTLSGKNYSAQDKLLISIKRQYDVDTIAVARAAILAKDGRYQSHYNLDKALQEKSSTEKALQDLEKEIYDKSHSDVSDESARERNDKTFRNTKVSQFRILWKIYQAAVRAAHIQAMDNFSSNDPDTDDIAAAIMQEIFSNSSPFTFPLDIPDIAKGGTINHRMFFRLVSKNVNNFLRLHGSEKVSSEMTTITKDGDSLSIFDNVADISNSPELAISVKENTRFIQAIRSNLSSSEWKIISMEMDNIPRKAICQTMEIGKMKLSRTIQAISKKAVQLAIEQGFHPDCLTEKAIPEDTISDTQHHKMVIRALKAYAARQKKEKREKAERKAEEAAERAELNW